MLTVGREILRAQKLVGPVQVNPFHGTIPGKCDQLKRLRIRLALRLKRFAPGIGKKGAETLPFPTCMGTKAFAQAVV